MNTSVSEALKRDELFPLLAQLGDYQRSEGRPGYDWVSKHESTYKDLVAFTVQNPGRAATLSDEIFQVLNQMVRCDRFHDFITDYLESEKSLRTKGASPFRYDIGAVENELTQFKPLFAAQYTEPKLRGLKESDVPPDLVTETAHRLVSLKDYLFMPNAKAIELPLAVLKDHKGRELQWP